MPAAGIAGSNWYPFRLGVASGSPLPEAVVLWTRILSEPGNPEAPAPGPLAVRWEVADDQAFKRIVASGSSEELSADDTIRKAYLGF